jgi:putative PEP-CTERM system integral membrane protein
MNENIVSVSHTRSERWARFLFWSWNIIFLTFMILGFAPRILPEMVTAVRLDTINLSFLMYALVLACIPLAAVLLGWTVLRGQSGKLFALGYVVEGPFMLMLAVRFFAVRQASTALTCLIIVTCFGLAAFLWDLLDRRIEQHGAWASWLRLFGLTLMLLISLYTAIWIAFYALPLGWSGLKWLLDTLLHLRTFFINLFGVRFLSFRDLLWLPFTLLGTVLGLYTATLFVLAPVTVPVLSYQAWKRALSALFERNGRLVPALASGLITVVVVGLFVVVNQQPQLRAFAMLEKPPESVEQARQLIAQGELLRKGLLNSYLGPFRYISSVGEVRHISDIYQSSFNLRPNAAYQVERVYEVIARPLLYEPIAITPFNHDNSSWDGMALRREPLEAARLYQQVFDEPIVDGERTEILNAVRSTWSSAQAEAALQALDERDVHLAQQEITIHEHGDWAEIELHEEYRNTTSERQEVVYYFSLPESAVITGVWLGYSPDRNQRFQPIVAPRGAAQAVYRNEVRQNLDPALVEQIGPRQYRLRVFPVPPVELHFNAQTSRSTIGEAPPLHLWLTWKTLAEQGGWSAPRLTLKRNIFWDHGTTRRVNGQPLKITDPDAWLPDTLPASEPNLPQEHQVDLPGGYRVTASPAGQASLPALPPNLHLAVVLDRSRSMQALSAETERALGELRAAAGAQIDVYLTSSSFRGEGPQRISFTELDTGQLEYLGGQNPAELLVQFDQLRGEQTYDAAIVLTDGSGYELGAGAAELRVPEFPVWLVHLGSAIPIGYDDQTLAVLQGSQGGVSGNLEQVMLRIAVEMAQSVSSSGPLLAQDLVDGYLWQVAPARASAAGEVATAANDAGFEALAARRVILAEMQRQRGKLGDPETLDGLHALAKEQSIVTPYSSMIVLVTERQEDLLEQLSGLDDRYQREVESLGETSPSTQLPLAGVPEPEEWLLMGLALAFAGYVWVTRGAHRLQLSATPSQKASPPRCS